MNTATQVASESPQAFDAAASGIRAFGAVGLVLALVILLAWLVRRGTLRFPGSRGPVAIRIESAASLGERRSVVIVNVEGRRLLLGMTPVQVSTLAELGPAQMPFADTLGSQLGEPAPGRES